jgi:hypothetical protein
VLAPCCPVQPYLITPTLPCPHCRQAVSDANYRIIAASVGKPGSVNDSIVLQTSSFFAQRLLLIPYPFWLSADKG